MLYDAEKKLVKLLFKESKKVITKIDTDIAIKIETKYSERARVERQKFRTGDVERKSLKMVKV